MLCCHLKYLLNDSWDFNAIIIFSTLLKPKERENLEIKWQPRDFWNKARWKGENEFKNKFPEIPLWILKKMEGQCTKNVLFTINSKNYKVSKKDT